MEKESWPRSRSLLSKATTSHGTIHKCSTFCLQKARILCSTTPPAPLGFQLTAAPVSHVFRGWLCLWFRTHPSALPPPAASRWGRGTPCGDRPVMSRFLRYPRYPPSCAGSRPGPSIGRTDSPSPRGTASPRTCPGHTTRFCSLGRGSGAFKACPERPGTRGRKGGPNGGSIHPPAARGQRGEPRSAMPRSPGSVGAGPALTLSPERRQQRQQQQQQPQRPGPAEVFHRRGALAPSGSGLSCGVQWAPPFRLAVAGVIPAA